MSDLTRAIETGSGNAAERGEYSKDEASKHLTQEFCASVDVRIGLCRLPAWTQSFWTWLTAIAMPSETRWRWKVWHHVTTTIVVFVVAAAVGTNCAQTLFNVTTTQFT